MQNVNLIISACLSLVFAFRMLGKKKTPFRHPLCIWQDKKVKKTSFKSEMYVNFMWLLQTLCPFDLCSRLLKTAIWFPDYSFVPKKSLRKKSFRKKCVPKKCVPLERNLFARNPFKKTCSTAFILVFDSGTQISYTDFLYKGL